MDLFAYNPETIMSFFLTFIRISLVVFLMPFFGGESLPVPVKAALCIILSIALHKSLNFPGAVMPTHPLALTLLLGGELLLGLTLSLVVQFVFAAVQAGGELAGMQMGFSMVTVVDPMSGGQETAVAYFLYFTAMLTFLSLDGHLFILNGLSHSFKLIPPGGLLLSPRLAENVLNLSAGVFVSAVKIAAPIIAALFLVDLALALAGKAAPQMNLMSLGFPAKIAVGFFFLGSMFYIISEEMRNFVGRIGRMFELLLQLGG